jgi:hypothetical protein
LCRGEWLLLWRSLDKLGMTGRRATVLWSDVVREKKSAGGADFFFWKVGGAAGEPPPGSEKPDCRFLQAQLRICLMRSNFSKPEFLAQQMQLFLGASRISLSVLAVLIDRGKDGNGNLSPTVVT